MSTRTGKQIAAVTLALLAAAQLAGCRGDDNSASNKAPTGETGSMGGTETGGAGGTGTGGDGGGAIGGDGGGGTGGDGSGASGGDGSGGTGGDVNSGGGGTPSGDLTTGTFVDAPVAGLSYTTSSSITGVTDELGRYDYRVGDTVTFSIGNLVLGAVVGQQVVTPVTLASAITASSSADADTVAVNLLMLLQSLDSNGNPDDGITFTAAIRTAASANSIDLTAAEGTFTTSLNTFVSNVSATSGATLTAVSRADAVDHFKSHAPEALAGTYLRADENFNAIMQKPVMLTMYRGSRYLLGGQNDSADCELDDSRTPVNPRVFSDARGNGVEHGAYTWDPLTNAFAVGPMTVETDGYCGFNEPVVGAENDLKTLEATAQGLQFKDEDGNVVYRFVRMQRETGNIAGAWGQPTGLMAGRPVSFAFFPSTEGGSSGRYLMVDATFANPAVDTTPGIEEGCYSVDAQDNLTVDLNSTCENAIDTNNTAGLSGDDVLQMFVDDHDRLVIADGDEWARFDRLPALGITHKAMAGSWMLRTSRDGELEDQPGLYMLTVFEDGRFLFGTQEDDPNCTPGDYPAPNQEADGNGVEYGTLSLTTVRGLVVPVTSVDTNGECGLFDATKEFQQRYYIAQSPDGDALLMWANDESSEEGMILTRVPSVPNSITGAWLWDDGDKSDDEFAIVAYLPGGVMFETSLLSDAFGLLRERFTYSGTTMTSQNAGYEFCLDTENVTSDCLGDPNARIIETFIVNGDTLTDDEGEAITRIPAP